MRIFKVFLAFLIILLTFGIQGSNFNRIVINSEYSLKDNLLFYQKIDTRGRSDFTFVGEEIWSFAPSSEDNLTFDYIYRYKVDFSQNKFELVGQIMHNFGHCNSVDYNSELDALIFGSGSTLEEEIYSRIYIVENVSKIKKDVLDINEDAITIDLLEQEQNFGNQINVCWEEGNRFFVFSSINNHKFIRLCELKKSEDRFDHFECVYTKQTNHSYEVCTQGLEFNNGIIYEGFGHNGVQLFLYKEDCFYLQKTKISYVPNIDLNDVKLKNITMQGVTIKDNHLFVCLTKNHYLTYFLIYDITLLNKF